MAKSTKEATPIGPKYDKTGDIWLTNQDTLRKMVGFLGMLLPLFLYLGLQLDSNFGHILPSISHYYYTRVGSILVIVVSLMAIFLLIYKGEERKDFYASSLAGIGALLLLLFPTNNLGDYSPRFDSVTKTILSNDAFRPIFHYVNAALFLGSLAYICLRLFTKGVPVSKRTKNKKIRNRIYRVCGVIMVLAMLVILLGFIFNPSWYDEKNTTFWMEVVAVEAFGYAWAVKGKSFFTDRSG